jgi:hypothetical protein
MFTLPHPRTRMYTHTQVRQIKASEGGRTSPHSRNWLNTRKMAPGTLQGFLNSSGISQSSCFFVYKHQTRIPSEYAVKYWLCSLSSVSSATIGIACKIWRQGLRSSVCYINDLRLFTRACNTEASSLQGDSQEKNVLCSFVALFGMHTAAESTLTSSVSNAAVSSTCSSKLLTGTLMCLERLGCIKRNFSRHSMMIYAKIHR